MSATTERSAITKRQQEIFEFIKSFRDDNGYCVSLQELCDQFGFASKNAVMCHLNPLRRRGWVTWNDGEARTLRPTTEAES